MPETMYVPSEAFAKIVGTEKYTMNQAKKRMWEYIKRQQLQDVTEKLFINADDNMRAVFGGADRMNMFEMVKLIEEKHLKVV